MLCSGSGTLTYCDVPDIDDADVAEVCVALESYATNPDNHNMLRVTARSAQFDIAHLSWDELTALPDSELLSSLAIEGMETIIAKKSDHFWEEQFMLKLMNWHEQREGALEATKFCL